MDDAIRYCPYCGCNVTPNYRFCPSCGKSLAASRRGEPCPEQAPQDAPSTEMCPFQLQVAWEHETYPTGVDSLARGLLSLESEPGVETVPTQMESHLVMVLDISGSMNVPDKYPLLREAMRLMVRDLEDGLYLSVVMFSTRAQLLCTALPASEARRTVADLVVQMDRSPIRFQETNLSQGLALAMDVVRASRARQQHVVPRLYILTDGELTDAKQCYALSSQVEALNIEVNSYGFGADFAFETMKRVMGHSPGGMVKHIRNTQDILETFQHIVEVTSHIVASEVRLRLRFRDGVIPGDFFCHRPAPRLWLASEFQPAQAPVFDLGCIEAWRKYVWAFEGRLPQSVSPGFCFGDLEASFRQRVGARTASWPLPVPVSDAGIAGPKNPSVERILLSLEDLRDSSLEAQIAAYEARIALAVEEKRDPAYVEALREVLVKLHQGVRKEEIEQRLLKIADATPSSTI